MTHLNRILTFFIAIVALALLPKKADAQFWLELFGQPTITGPVRSIARDKNTLYVSGQLLSVADQRARGLATFNTVTEVWSPVNLDLGRGFTHMAIYGEGNNRGLYGAGLPDHPLVRIQNGLLVDIPLDGSISGLRSVFLQGREVLVASGSFTSDENVFGLALWNGQRWHYLAELTPFTSQLTILNRDGKNVIYALSASDNLVVEYDGLSAVYREVPLLRDVSSISHLSGDLAACDGREGLLTFFDGIGWPLLPVYSPNIRGCRKLTMRRFEDRDQLLHTDFIGNWWVYDASGANPTQLQLPVDGDRSTKPIPAAEETALVTLSARQSSRQLAIWERNDWVQPEESFRSTKLRAHVRSAHSHDGKTFVFGKFGVAPEPLQTAIAVFGDGGISNLTTLPDQSTSAVMDNSGIVYAWTPEGLWINREEGAELIGVPEVSARAALALTDSGQLYVASCERQLLRLQGDALEVVAELPDNLSILCNVPLVAIPDNSPANGVYFVVATPPYSFHYGHRVSVWRFDGQDLTEVSPTSLEGFVAHATYLPQVSSISMNGHHVPAIAFGDMLTWFNGQQWISLPPIPSTLLAGGEVSGPVATANVGSDGCLFAALRTQIVKHCNNRWSTSNTLAMSFVNTIDLIYQRGIQTLVASQYQGRSVLLVGGNFDSAGNSTQSRTAVLDLDGIHRDGFEL